MSWNWRQMLNISLPDQIQRFVEAQMISTGFHSVDEYIYYLILREQERLSQQAQVEALLLEGLDSGEPLEATDAWWEGKRTQLMARFQASET